jgi:hypothetical protein
MLGQEKPRLLVAACGASMLQLTQPSSALHFIHRRKLGVIM